ncbi:MAG: hypothetical protein Q9217_003681 [Psora testacea]
MSSSTPPAASTPPTSIAPSQAPDPERTAQARAAVTAHLSALGEQHLKPLKQRASDIRASSSAIDKQEAALRKQTEGLEKESKKLHKEADEASKKLKELGDIQNWAEVLERDLLVVEETLRMGEGEDLGWETEEGEERHGEERGEEGGGGNENGNGARKETNEESVHAAPTKP